MIEGYLGEDAFRQGVRIYLRRHAEANASADDFWRALDESSGQDVTKIANAWIKEPGHPLVEIEARVHGDGLELALSQTRYFSDQHAAPTAQLWPVPLVIKYGTREGIKEERVLFSAARETVALPGARWLYPNVGGKGFYRFALAGIAGERLDEGIRELGAEERLNAVENQWALTRHGKAPLSAFLRRLETLRGEDDRAVLAAIADALTWIGNYAVRPSTERPFQRLVEELFRPILEKTGWDPRDGEDSDTREKRTRAIGMLGIHARAADVRDEAQRRVRAHLDGSERLHPDVAGVVIGVGATIGDAALWERYVARMKEAAASDAQEEARFRQGLLSFEEPALIERTAELIFSPTIRTMERGLMIIPLMQSRVSRQITWDVLRAKWDTEVARADLAPLLKQAFPNAVSQLAQPELAGEAIAFLEAKRTPDIAETVAQSIERLRVNAAAAERLARELEDSLKVPA
jgi:puromycin-sensitive aminopeptidase